MAGWRHVQRPAAGGVRGRAGGAQGVHGGVQRRELAPRPARPQRGRAVPRPGEAHGPQQGEPHGRRRVQGILPALRRALAGDGHPRLRHSGPRRTAGGRGGAHARARALPPRGRPGRAAEVPRHRRAGRGRRAGGRRRRPGGALPPHARVPRRGGDLGRRASGAGGGCGDGGGSAGRVSDAPASCPPTYALYAHGPRLARPHSKEPAAACGASRSGTIGSTVSSASSASGST
mmetsp:Transcript_18865/g.64247  ORF Transcript_18865/g.64247 Transcript_18865/m.64247 type:complete len:232 (-) Transcript_18865:637-1332(-)